MAPPGPFASTLMFAGTVTIGASLSCTVIVKESEVWLPESSDAVHVT